MPGRFRVLPVLSLVLPILFMSSACGGACTEVGAASGVEVVVTGDAARADSDTRMDVTTCVRSHCPGAARNFSRGERATFFIEAPWVDSDEPVEVQVTVHEGTRVVAGPTTFTVRPEVVQPNGPDCEPTEHVAKVEIPAHP
jgi:hypothetical protein